MDDNSEVKAWSASAQALALLAAVHQRGWTAFLAERRSRDELATFSGLAVDRLRDVLEALQAHGVVELTDLTVRLAAPYAALLSGDAPFSMTDLLDEAQMMNRLVADAVSGAPPVPGDALIVANSYGPRATPAAQAMFSLLLDALPDLRETLRDGYYLDVGVGVGGFVLSTALIFPQMRALGVELVPEVAAEGARRAAELRVDDRVKIRCMDARNLSAENEFDVAFWAQPFFPSSSRSETLAAVRRALKPGARLYMQEMERAPDSEAQTRAFALRRLVFSGWGVPFARSAEDLAVEAEAAGFVRDRVATTALGRIVVSRKVL